MPQIREVTTLRKACVNNIAENIDSFWCRYFDGVKAYNELRFSNEDGPPFKCLTGSLMTEIIENLKKRNLLKKRQSSLVITSKLEALKLSQRNLDECPFLYKLISQRCENSLKELRISNYALKSQDKFLLMAEKLRKLEILDLRGHDVTDDVLAVLGSSCPELRELNVSGSESVTNQGIEYLCVETSSYDGMRRNSKWKLLFRSYKNHSKLFGSCGGADSTGVRRPLERNQSTRNAKRTFGRCKLLSRLHLRETLVDKTGIETAIRNLPHLKYLNHHLVVSVLGEMHRLNQRTSPTPQYRLQTLFAGYGYYNGFVSDILDTLSLSCALECCPCITEVHFELSNLSTYPDAIKPLCKVNHLKTLDLSVLQDLRGSSFCASVVPILNDCGHSITTLYLAGFNDLDCEVIGKCCPSLEDLFLFMNRSNCGNKSPNKVANSSSDEKICSFLKIFKLNAISKGGIEAIVRPDGDAHVYDIPQWQLKQILSAPSLENVKIFGSTSLSDSLVREVIKRHSFVHLRELEFAQCPCVTADSIRMFLQLPGPLKSISLHVCPKISPLEYESFVSMIKKNNWELQIDWKTL